MKRNGLVFVPPETPKRVILYPTQESASQQQSLNGQQNRARTALVTNTHNESPHSATNNARLTRQQTISGPLNGSAKPSLSNSKISICLLSLLLMKIDYFQIMTKSRPWGTGKDGVLLFSVIRPSRSSLVNNRR